MNKIAFAGKDNPLGGIGRLGEDAIGFYSNSPNPKISITFEQETFDAILEYAGGKSFGRAVRELVRIGLRARGANLAQTPPKRTRRKRDGEGLAGAI